MKTAGFVVSVLLLCALPARAQGRGWPQPPEPAEKTQVTPKPATPEQKLRVDTVELQREARELSDLATTLPADMMHVSHGLLPKDTIDKLKRIEKLSKHLRGEINP
jgi:hypothetical protein